MSEQSWRNKALYPVSTTTTDVQQARIGLTHLLEGHTILRNMTMPFQKTFWSPGFGMCVDRFGIPWMVNSEQAG